MPEWLELSADAKAAIARTAAPLNAALVGHETMIDSSVAGACLFPSNPAAADSI
jgi:hypothetical protein